MIRSLNIYPIQTKFLCQNRSVDSFQLNPRNHIHSAGVVLLVLESALDDLELVATAGALNPLDVLVIGGQDSLQLRLEGVRLHFGVCIYHRALLLKCSCIDAVLKSNQNTVNDERMDVGPL